MTRPARRATMRVALALGGALLAGCSTVSGWFSAAPTLKPAALETITPAIAGRQVWSQRLDSVDFPLAITVTPDATSVAVAGTGGRVTLLAADNGRELWHADVGAKLSAGVGSDGTTAAVVTRDNELVAVSAGKVLWRVGLPSRVVTSPFVAGERVFVVGVDRTALAFDAVDGRRLWTLARPGEPLTVAQPGVLAAYKDTLLVGQGTRLVGVDPVKGTTRWEVPVSSPRGTNEVERLADLVGPVARVGAVFCVRSFQSAVGCVDAERNALVWSKNIGGASRVAADEDYVFASDGSDRLNAWRRASGEALWNADRFLNRGLSGPASVGQTLVFGDREGYVHFLARDTGKTLLRLTTDGSAVAAAPAVAGTTVIVATRNGGVFAFRPQ